MTTDPGLLAALNDWRKGVALIASALGEKNQPDLCCARIAEKALHYAAVVEAAQTLANLNTSMCNCVKGALEP